MAEEAIFSMPPDDLIVHLSSSRQGLSLRTADERIFRQRREANIRPRWEKTLALLARQFSSPLIILMAVAVVFSMLLGQYSDGSIILVILLASALLAFWQELNAGRSVELLEKMIETKHAVLREGRARDVPVNEVVEGDVLVLNAGDIIPADSVLIESRELRINESALTGESFPVDKTAELPPAAMPVAKRPNCLWAGTNVITGDAKAIVVKTGRHTVFARITKSLEANVETVFEQEIKRFGYFLLRITVILAIVVLLANLAFGKELLNSVLFSLALAVGMAPELLPAIMSIAMSKSAKRLVQKKVIVKKLASIFNFGQVTVLCTDKTGTVTEGNVVVKDVVDTVGQHSEQLRLYAFLNASMQTGFTNPVDEAIISWKVDPAGYTKTDEIPYDFNRKRLSISVSHNNTFLLVTKGAFRNVLDCCSTILIDGNARELSSDMRQQAIDRYISWSSEGYRVLGLASKTLAAATVQHSDENAMTFLGFILLEETLKAGAKQSMDRLQELRVTVKVITGDNRYAAVLAAKHLGMQNPVVMTGEEIAALSADALTARVSSVDVFAETEPQHKELIVRAVRKSGAAVAYMGDGINDVAAIHAADIGISTNDAVPVAREAADIVLLEKDLSVLADGIYEGRRCFANTLKYIFITTGATFGNMFSVAGASLVLPFLPMLPAQILCTNLISDMPFLAIAADHVSQEELSKPGKWRLRTLRHFMIVFGLHSSVFDFITFWLLYHYFQLSGSYFQTGWFLESVSTELLLLLVIRTKSSFFKRSPGKSIKLFCLFAFLITAILPFTAAGSLIGLSPLDSKPLFFLLLILLLYVLSADLLKIYFFRSHDEHYSDTAGVATVAPAA
jgi:Mg2+-importing ATPase